MGAQLSSSPFAPSPEAVWATAFDAVCERIGPVFARSETRERAQSYLRGFPRIAQRDVISSEPA